MNKYILYLLWSAFITYYGLSVYINEQYATGGYDIASLQEQKEKLQKENAVLQEQILKAQSLTEIEKKAKEAGMIEATYVYIPSKK